MQSTVEKTRAAVHTLTQSLDPALIALVGTSRDLEAIVDKQFDWKVRAAGSPERRRDAPSSPCHLSAGHREYRRRKNLTIAPQAAVTPPALPCAQDAVPRRRQPLPPCLFALAPARHRPVCAQPGRGIRFVVLVTPSLKLSTSAVQRSVRGIRVRTAGFQNHKNGVPESAGWKNQPILPLRPAV